ncbi:MAG: HAD-superfamily hydrolase, subfamily variant 3 [Phycisphaerales bacterium]|nr:HAD-superfamily hydrolase, subfamily variant 3 [Phycisphaerales bacterium]
MSPDLLMRECLNLARTAMRLGEVPIAAVIAHHGQIIGWGWNELNAKRDRTMHAEFAAFRDAAGRYPLDTQSLTLVSTLEPCVMCFGAALLAGVSEIIYALPAPADGGARRVSKPSSPEAKWPAITGNILADEARELFEQWLRDHPGEDHQKEFVTQLLASI